MTEHTRPPIRFVPGGQPGERKTWTVAVDNDPQVSLEIWAELPPLLPDGLYPPGSGAATAEDGWPR
ncbi:hypothetical protein OG871_40060 (plasmid) [Kitasatospora sp. NBC_00374]|uniref:hypothetical protein n=1 Tax=Kitasatospora sp. NBC_00374 TaxID=2975964 RepID=UPI002F916FF6